MIKKKLVFLLCTILTLPAVMPARAEELEESQEGLLVEIYGEEEVIDEEEIIDTSEIPEEIFDGESEIVIEEEVYEAEDVPCDAGYIVSPTKSGNITWSIDSAGKLLIEGTGNYTINDGAAPWNFDFDNCEKITSAEVDLTGMTSTKYMFAMCWNLKSVTFRRFDTSKVTDMSNMFEFCESLTSLDVSEFDTSKVTDMSDMFMGCTKLTSLDVSGFKTGNVKKFTAMFETCSSLTSLDVSGFDVSAATDLSQMFCGCSKLKNLDLGGFDLKKAVNNKSEYDNALFLFLEDCGTLSSIVTPKNLLKGLTVPLPKLSAGKGWCDGDGNAYTVIPQERLEGLLLMPRAVNSSTPTDPVTPGAPTGPVPPGQIRYDGNGATEGIMLNQAFIEYGNVKLNPNVYIRTGYLFAGWNTTKDGTGTAYKNKQTVKKLTNNGSEGVTLYAVWNPVKYSVVYNGNKKTSGSVKTQTKIAYDTSFKISENKFKKKGCVFTGWNTAKDGSGTAYKEGEDVTNLCEKSNGKVTLYAQWQEIVYNLSYVLNDGNIDKDANPKTFTVSTPRIKLAIPERTGYIFKGWYQTEDFKKKLTYINKGSIDDRKLYAKWAPIKYTVMYNGNGKTAGSMGGQGGRQYDTEYTLKPNTFVRDGYTFKGWALTPVPEAGDKIYSDGAAYKNLTTQNGAKIIFYAVWK